MTNTDCYEYSVKAPDDGQQICPKRVEFFTKIKLRNSASLGFYYKNIMTCLLAGGLEDYSSISCSDTYYSILHNLHIGSGVHVSFSVGSEPFTCRGFNSRLVKPTTFF